MWIWLLAGAVVKRIGAVTWAIDEANKCKRFLEASGLPHLTFGQYSGNKLL